MTVEPDPGLLPDRIQLAEALRQLAGGADETGRGER